MNLLKSFVNMFVCGFHFSGKRTIAFTSTMVTAKWLNKDYSRIQFHGRVSERAQSSILYALSLQSQHSFPTLKSLVAINHGLVVWELGSPLRKCWGSLQQF